VTNNGDTSACTFTFSIDWGDGSPAEQVTENGQSESGDFYLADYTYQATETTTYTVTLTPVSLTGDCTSYSASFTFTLDVESAPPAAPSYLTATPVDENDIQLTWQDNSTDETGFEINNGVTSNYAGAGSTSYTWGDLSPGT